MWKTLLSNTILAELMLWDTYYTSAYSSANIPCPIQLKNHKACGYLFFYSASSTWVYD